MFYTNRKLMLLVLMNLKIIAILFVYVFFSLNISSVVATTCFCTSDKAVNTEENIDNSFLLTYDAEYNSINNSFSEHKNYLFQDVEYVSIQKPEDSIFLSNNAEDLNKHLASIVAKSFKWTESCELDVDATIVGFKYKQHYSKYVNKFESVLASSGYKKGSLYKGEETLEKIQLLISDVFTSWGYYNSTISVSADSTERVDRKVIVIDVVSDGERKSINKINFSGNTNESTLSLKFAISYMEACLWGNFTESSLYSRNMEEDLKKELRNYYLDHGYLKTEISVELVHYTDKTIGEVVDVNIFIDEGFCYKVNDTFVQCNEEQCFEHINIVQNIAVKFIFKGEVYCHKYVKRTIGAISDYCNSCGYINNKVILSLIFHEDTKCVDLQYDITIGRRVKVFKINFVGNYFTQDYVLRRCCTQQELDWINPNKIKSAKDIILNHKFGTSVKIKQSKPKTGGADFDFVDITYILREIEQTVVAFTATTDLTTYEISSIADCRLKNLFGTGQNLNTIIIRTPRLSSYSVDYINTRFENNRIGLGMRGTWRIGHDDYKLNKVFSKYKYSWFEDKMGYDTYLCYFLNRYHRLHIGVGGKHTKLYTNIELAPFELNEYLQKYYINGVANDYYVFFGSSYSSLDNPVWPNNGCVQQVEFKVTVPPTRPISYCRFDYYVNTFIELDNDENNGYILNLHGRLGYADTYGMYDPNGNSVPYPFLRNLHCDSSSWVRGLKLGSGGAILDNVISSSTRHDLRCGSNFAACLKTNLYIKSKYFRSFDEIFRPGLYLDIGTMFNTNDFLTKLQLDSVVPHRVGFGVTAVFKSPILGTPVELSIGRILNRQPTDNLEGDFFGFVFTVTVANCSL